MNQDLYFCRSIVLNAFDGQKILKSKPLKLHIKPLPKAGRPPQFSGAVGNFFLRGSLERNRSIIGEPVTYTIELNGEMIVEKQEIPGITGGALNSREGEAGPILLQGDHGPVYFRNLILTPVKQ